MAEHPLAEEARPDLNEMCRLFYSDPYKITPTPTLSTLSSPESNRAKQKGRSRSCRHNKYCGACMICIETLLRRVNKVSDPW